MNPFRSRKKSHDAGESRRPSVDSDAPPVPSFASKTFKRSKKPMPEPKQEVNIAAALPSSDDFRTSLLMPNLSARFSMLREQDDPTSKIGKANDDSVLFPKRASRLNLFNRNELTDIAEVDSIRSSVRPPLAPWKTDSYGSFDGYGTEDDGSRFGSVMSRARPGEGNTMFGGRQKIYKINVGGTGSSRNVSGSEDGDISWSKGMGGKVLYGDDVSSSAFQKLREQEKREQETADPDPESVRSSKEYDRSSSPPAVSYNQYRETASSITSVLSESRISTAATSVASQRSMHGHGNMNGSPHAMSASAQASTNALNIDRQNHKSRRLYGQGLDQHMFDQQSSAVNRIESLHRQRGVIGATSSTRLSQSRSANNLNEQFQRSGPVYASNPPTASSPHGSGTPPRLAEFDLSLHEAHPVAARSQHDAPYCRSPPLSPPMSPIQDPALIAALEPNDVGKATASGAFNKPRKQYNEQQYLQRQLQLQQGRETPPLSRSFSPSTLSVDEPTAGRVRNNSVTSAHSRPISLKNHQGSNEQASSVASPNQDLGAKVHPDDQHRPNQEEKFLARVSPGDKPVQLKGLSTSQENLNPSPSRYQQPSNVLSEDLRLGGPPDQVHPLYRSHHPAYLHPPSKTPVDNASETTVAQELEMSPDTGNPKGFDADSPTLGPVTGVNGLNGLNGLVRAHLRNGSGQSSVYPEQSPDLISTFPRESRSEGVPNNGPEARRSEASFHKEAWDTDVPVRRHESPGVGVDNPAIPPPLSFRARQILDQAHALRNHEAFKAKQLQGNHQVQRIVIDEAPRASQESSNVSWQDQLKAHHTRDGSTETEKERESFANELAERRRMVRDNLKSFVENESRSVSPMPGARAHENSPSKPGAPFGVLRTNSGRGSLAARQDPPSKAMKMLGINATPSHSNGSSRSGYELVSGNEFDQPPHLLHDRKPPANARAAQPGFQNPNYSQPQRQRDFSNEQSLENLPRRTSPPSSKSSRSGRSNFESPERRSGGPDRRNRGELYGGGVNGSERVNGYHADMPQYRTYSNAPRSAPELMESVPSKHEPLQPPTSDRLRSNSKSNSAAGYFEPRGKLAVQTNSPYNHTLSPGTPYITRSATSLHDHSSNTPLVTTPVMMTPSPSTLPARVPTHRKRSINKQDISDPTFISSTSSVGTINLPPGASLSNGMESPQLAQPPPVPPLNPRRKRTQTLLQALGRPEKTDPSSAPNPAPSFEAHEERSTFSADEREHRFKGRQRIRKTSSEGGSMNGKVRQQVLLAPSPAVPPFPQNRSPPLPSSGTPTFPHPGVQIFPQQAAAGAGTRLTTFPSGVERESEFMF